MVLGQAAVEAQRLRHRLGCHAGLVQLRHDPLAQRVGQYLADVPGCDRVPPLRYREQQVRPDEQEDGQRYLHDDRHDDARPPVGGVPTEHHVEPRVAQHQRRGRHEYRYRPAPPPRSEPPGRHEAGQQGDVEADPDQLPLLAVVLVGQAHREVDDPWREDHRRPDEEREQPPPGPA